MRGNSVTGHRYGKGGPCLLSDHERRNKPINPTGQQRALLAVGRRVIGGVRPSIQVDEARRMTTSAVYLETSVIGYATSRLSRDLVVAAHQQITREWFASPYPGRYELFVSQLVVSEASGGDPEGCAGESGLPPGNPAARHHGRGGPTRGQARRERGRTRQAAEDALHIAVAAVHGRRLPLDLELQAHRECGHAASHSQGACREAGYEPPVICTPEELMNDEQV